MNDLIMPLDLHNTIVTSAYLKRGFNQDEADKAARFCAMASWHGIKTHNAIKALHLDDLFGSGNQKSQGCTPRAEIEEIPNRFKACTVWNAHKKLGQAVAFNAIEQAMTLADEYGVGIVSVDEAFHYLWGGGYVMEAAKRGYIAYTCCTAALAEVVPFMGKHPTLGTNPHSWAFPTMDALGYPIVIDWATSTVAMGRVQQFKRENKQLPPDAAVDSKGNPTQDPHNASALLPFGKHKGYGLSLINELVAALIGGSLPTLRSRPENITTGTIEKTTPNFYFQVIHPDAVSSGLFADKRNQSENTKAVILDILGHGNENCLLPGQLEHQAACESDKAGGLLFTEAEILEFEQIAKDSDIPFTIDQLVAHQV
ncbi:2,3-diketo-L-gulonate reductase [Poriferisphaera corsica]|uniref:2,3-diketo-L-gulonate reductase n=1 Tax=Poriferisphaera corsica TaxID=2528020 RepID=A0A517YQV1_9BACT|nr:Ldh family oxidoreductase [Poriferisphaera corsica]QDU32606.1 2,3-diketo-L-gulonate reductase [Poriferisphaera corsica]